MKSNDSRVKTVCWGLTMAICLSLPIAIRAADKAAGNSAKLDEVLGRSAEWKVTPEDYVLSGKAGNTALAGAAGLTLDGNVSKAAPCEYLLTCRLKATAGSPASINVQMACAERADKTQQFLAFSVSADSTLNQAGYTLSAQGSRALPSVAGILYFLAVNERSLTWSEEMRRSIEAQIASAPKVEKTLFNIRCTVEKGRFRGWLNGRFIGEIELEDGMDPSGVMKIQLSPGAELVSVREQAHVIDPRFEPVSIAGHLNAATLHGAKIDRASLPWKASAEKNSVVDGIPFRFPGLSVKGEDHVDVGVSWTRFGGLTGWHAAGGLGTMFGGRWISADRIDPCRIAMYIPKGRYKALHLIAAVEDRKDSVPIVTAQFYRPDAGHPVNFAGTVPASKETDVGSKTRGIPIKLQNGKSAKLHHVTIPLDPDGFSWFTDLDRIGLEITKEVHFYRGYPEPLDTSWHAGGLPSSVQIYAMTLERASTDVEIQPDQVGHIWTAPALPSYTIQLRNPSDTTTKGNLVVTTRSYDGKDVTRQEQKVSLLAHGEPVKVQIALKPTRYGLHEVSLDLTLGEGAATTYKRNFAWLHEDTRDHTTWEAGRGSIFGYWPWGGTHVTPPVEHEIPVMAAAGAETTPYNYSNPVETPEKIGKLAEKHHFIFESAFVGAMYYYNSFASGDAAAPKYDPTKPEETGKALVEAMRKYKCEPGPSSRPLSLPFFPEPQLGPITMAVWPSCYGEEYKLSDVEQATFDDYRTRYLIAARAIRKEWPELKLLMPYGDPMNTLIFLKLSPESRDLIDGCALDLPGFDLLPEQQVHQVVLNRLYPIMKEIKKYKKDPYLVMVEGTHTPSKDIALGDQGQADVSIRNFLCLMGYGVNRFESSNSPFDCAGYWGENHYGGGWCARLPLAMPKLAYVHYATITRHLNRANFIKYVPTGSTSTYCQEYKHYKTGKLIHVLWTIRGKRPVNVKVPPGATLEVYDQNDNVTTLKEKNGVVTVTADQSPQYLEGLAAEAVMTLGESDHSDAQPTKESRRIGNLGDGSWKLVEKEDVEYTKNKPLQIVRFPGKMNAKAVDAPVSQGGKALAIHLEKQEKDRGVMPFYTTLEPKEAIAIPGKASHLGMWVHAASDWGRVIYSLRDAKGEKWISVGTKEAWTNDDIHCWSAFCFDGWRYLRFEMPSSAPYDSYREHGTLWWGSFGGDGVVDLPLKLKKVIVERRPKVVYGNDLVEAKADDVLLGDLNAEYSNAADQGEEVVRLSKLRMPVPEGVPDLGNPIADLAKSGEGAPTKVLKVMDPAHQYDGTRCHVHFDLVRDAKSYDVWVSPYSDGRGAMQLGTSWTESGKLIESLRPDIEFHLFVVYTDRDGKLSKPSKPFPFKLKDRFAYK